MIEKVDTKPIMADPSKYSLLEETLNLEFQGKEKRISITIFGDNEEEVSIYIDKNTGEKFHKIPDKNDARFQKLVALMLKGVINVSDVVKVGSHYYSHEQNFHKIEPGKENIIAEMEADIFILEAIAGDFDHAYYPIFSINRKQTEAKNPHSFLQHHNLLIDELNNKLNFFDFQENALNSMAFHKDNLGILQSKFKAKLTELPKPGLDENELFAFFRKKIQILTDLFNINEFQRFKKILQRVGIEFNEEQERTLFGNIKLRLEALSNALLELEPSK